MSTGEDPSTTQQPPGQSVDQPPTAPQQDQPGAVEQREAGGRKGRKRAPNMLPGRERRTLGVERFLVRIVATAGIVGIGVALGAILASSKTQGWIIGLVVAIVSVVLSGILWSSRQL